MRHPREAFADTLHAILQDIAARHPERTFLHVPRSACTGYSDGPLTYRYAEAAARVATLLRHYREAGIDAGDRVALLLENRPDAFFHWFALNGAGASVVPLNPALRRRELAYVLEHSEAALVVTLPEYAAALRQAASDVAGDVPPVVTADEVAAGAPLHPSRPGVPVAAARRSAAADTECALVYTSGTTGRPKGCVLPNDYFVRSGLRYLNRRGHVRIEPGQSRILTPLPMFHINAMASSTMGVLMSGSCLIQLDRFHPRTWWRDVVDSGATAIHCLGVMPAILLEMPPTDDDHRHAVRYGTAANVEPGHHAAFEARFGFPLVEGWSMTETGAGAAISADDEPRHVGTRCIGRPGAGLEVRLVDELGAEVAVDTPGELLVRAAGDRPRLGFFDGYLKDAAATAAGWADGWWHTGDILVRWADGTLHFVDRSKNVIRRSGENVSALDVEQALRGDPAVADLAVTAVADPLRGEEVFAFVVPSGRTAGGTGSGDAGSGDAGSGGIGSGDVDSGAAASDASVAYAIVTRALAAIAYHKVPGWIAFVDALPLTATQKLQRGELREQAARAVASGGCHDLRALKRRPVTPR